MVTLKKILTCIAIVIVAIAIIGAISTGDVVFVSAGILSLFPLALTIKKFVNENSGGYEA